MLVFLEDVDFDCKRSAWPCRTVLVLAVVSQRL